MSIAQAGVFLPFKQLLQGSGMIITETPTTITIGTTGAGPGGGDMLQSQYATNGVAGVVDKAVLAEGLTTGATVPFATSAGAVPWGGITGVPSSFPSSWGQITGIPTTFPTTWAQITGIPLTFPPTPHEATHLPGGTDALPLASSTSPGLLAQLSGRSTDYVGGDNQVHTLPGGIADGDVTAPSNPTPYDDEFTATALNPKWAISGTKALVTAALTGNNFLQLAFQYGATGTIQVRATESVNTAAGFGFQVKMRFALVPYWDSSTNGVAYASSAGFGLLTALTNRSISVFVSAQNFTSGAQYYYYLIYISKGNNGASQNATVDPPLMVTGTDLRFKIWNDISGGTPGQLSVAMSTDGTNWVTIYSEAFANGGSLNGNFPSALFLDLDSLGLSTGGGGSGMVAFDYVRKIS